MLFHLPKDLKNFNRFTMDKPIIMGRNTYESIGHALPGRTNIIVSKTLADDLPDCKVCRTLDEAIGYATISIISKSDHALISSSEIMIIGGGEIYKQAMCRAKRLLITHINATANGDTYFPHYDLDEWVEKHSTSNQDGDITWTFRILERAN